MIRKALREWLELLREGLATAPAPPQMAAIHVFSSHKSDARDEVESSGRLTHEELTHERHAR